MDINKVLMEYDNMFGIHSLDEIDTFLTDKIDEAMGSGDYSSAVTLMNEMLGLCRDTNQTEKGLQYCEKVLRLMDDMGLSGTVNYATTLLNVANDYRAFRKFKKALDLFKEAEAIYKKELPDKAFEFASLYNNWALLYQEVSDFESSKVLLKKALGVVLQYPEAKIQQASSQVNLAATELRLCQDLEQKMDDMNLTQDETELEMLRKMQQQYEAFYAEAMECLTNALRIFEEDGGRDFHYSAALSAMGDACFMKEDYVASAGYYKRSMEELEKHVGKTEAYQRVEEYYERAMSFVELETVATVPEPVAVQEKTESENVAKMSNLERCRLFYERYGASMIHDKFPQYEKRIAVGLCGEGSDCFGYDDDISMDHDYGIGFCMWLTTGDYEKIGLSLNKAYEDLLTERGREFLEEVCPEISVASHMQMLISRRGVFSIGNFYETILGVRLDEKKVYLQEENWLSIDEANLATAINGAIFRDDLGAFTRVREQLMKYYPKKVMLLRLAQHLHEFSQNGQSNYARMMAREDYVTANICIAQATKAAMQIAYVLNRTYAPYYKWMRRGLKDLFVLRGIGARLDELSLFDMQADAWKNVKYSAYEVNTADKKIQTIEAIAEMILEELRNQDFVRGTETFLDAYCNALIEQGTKEDTTGGKGRVAGSAYEGGNRMSKLGDLSKDELVNEIVKMEWMQFDQVKNKGGRADCQDDWNTFSIMRKSQYQTWNEELLVSFLNDLLDAEERGWNIITEKYARMMQSTAPEEYAELAGELPIRSEKRLQLTEEVVKIQMDWMEEFAEAYPKMTANARSLHTTEDTAYNTSYETYLRGELGTYSEATFILYVQFIVTLSQAGNNLAYMIMDNTAKLYGYEDVDAAEAKLE